MKNLDYKSIFTTLGVSGMRRSVRRGKVLPHPRTVTLQVATDKEVRTHKNSELFVFFAQLTAHSVTQTITTHGMYYLFSFAGQT